MEVVTGKKNNILKNLRKFLYYLSLGLEYCALILMVLMTSITMYQVIMRFIFKNPSSWSEELTIFLMIWVGFLGMVIGLKERKHTTMDFVVDLFPPNIKKIIEKCGDIIVLVFNILMFKYGFTLMGNAGKTVLPATSIPIVLMYLPLVVAGGTSILFGLVHILGLEETLLKK